MKTIKFTKAELNHLINLIIDNERDGTYYGNKNHYWKRSLNLKEKLLSFDVCSEKCLNNYADSLPNPLMINL